MGWDSFELSFMNRRSRIAKGQSFVELAAGLAVVIPVILLIIDCATIYMGVQMNDSVCRDAARAASIGAPEAITAGEPQRRAEGVVRKANKTAGAIRLDDTVKVTEQITGDLPTAPYGGPVKGEVTVVTTVHVFPPFLISLFAGPGGVDFKAQESMPYTWSMASTATMQAPSAGNSAGKTF